MKHPAPFHRDGLLGLLSFVILSLNNAQAGSATWNLNPASSDWNIASNWSPATVPNGAADTATFGLSNTAAVNLSANTTVSSVIFNAGASAFTITNPGLSLTIDGPGLINNSGVTQNFVCNAFNVAQGGLITFTGSASAGNQNNFTSNGVPGGHNSSISFFDTATAGSASFVVNGSDNSNATGLVDFYGHSTAAIGTFTCNGSTTGGGGGGAVIFHEQANAGAATFTTFGGVASGGGGGNGGAVRFFDTASAAECTITNNAVLPGGSTAGLAYFGGSATAGNATITNKGGTPTSIFGGLTFFTGDATAGDAIITSEGGSADFVGDGGTLFIFGGNGGNATLISNAGATRNADGATTEFGVGSSAGNATLIANSATQDGPVNGGQILFSGDSDGGTARVILWGNGTLFLSNHDDGSPITVGSVEGNGRITLAYRDLKVGSNHRNAVFSGRINSQGGDGTITKIGRGTWTLTGDNSYSAGTFINGGRLVANNNRGSATGTSPVLISKGTLAGRGTLAGTVTVGEGRGRAAEISPGTRADQNVGALTIQSALTFASDGSYAFQVDSDIGLADSLSAAGVTIESGAQFNARDIGSGTLTTGASFVVLENTTATPIAGTFGNLPDGSIIIIGSHNFQASYEGGDGNDLALTVVP